MHQLKGYTVGALRHAVDGLCDAQHEALMREHTAVYDDDETDDEGVLSLPRRADLEATLRSAERLALETAVRGGAVLDDARRRAALTEGTAGVGPGVDAVRRHETHLQRQLASTLGLLDGARARRARAP